ncbi:MAG: hypothetical protein QOD30_1539, partial [Actinomycetota bacterium]|nr:hypothetical protein [Actinomycetota bacterium]
VAATVIDATATAARVETAATAPIDPTATVETVRRAATDPTALIDPIAITESAHLVRRRPGRGATQIVRRARGASAPLPRRRSPSARSRSGCARRAPIATSCSSRSRLTVGSSLSSC